MSTHCSHGGSCAPGNFFAMRSSVMTESGTCFGGAAVMRPLFRSSTKRACVNVTFACRNRFPYAPRGRIIRRNALFIAAGGTVLFES